MLASISAEALVEMWAAYRVIPLPDSWRESGTIAATIHNEMERLFAMKAEKRRIDEDRLHDPEDYIPSLSIKSPDRVKVDQRSIDDMQRRIERQFIG